MEKELNFYLTTLEIKKKHSPTQSKLSQKANKNDFEAFFSSPLAMNIIQQTKNV